VWQHRSVPPVSRHCSKRGKAMLASQQEHAVSTAGPQGAGAGMKRSRGRSSRGRQAVEGQWQPGKTTMPAQGARCDGGISGGGGASSSSNGGSSGGSTTGVGPCNNDGKHRVARQIVGDRGKRAAYQRIATRTMAAAVAEATETSTGVNSGNSGSSGGSGGRSSGNVDTSQQCRQSSRNVQVEELPGDLIGCPAASSAYAKPTWSATHDQLEL
ncbi:hypothetical protein QJQ45_020186, partial [Haematococcus lacustris]